MSPTERTVTQALAPVNQRSTRQRAAITAALGDIEDFRSAQEIHDILRNRGESVGLSTVYRSLQAMAEVDEIDVILDPDGQFLYRHCGQSGGHHHHLVCRDCGLTVEVEGRAVERWTHTVAEQHGFTEVSHTLDIFGVCGNCVTPVRRRRA